MSHLPQAASSISAARCLPPALCVPAYLPDGCMPVVTRVDSWLEHRNFLLYLPFRLVRQARRGARWMAQSGSRTYLYQFAVEQSWFFPFAPRKASDSSRTAAHA